MSRWRSLYIFYIWDSLCYMDLDVYFPFQISEVFCHYFFNTLLTRHICLLLPKCYWPEAYQYHLHKLPTTGISFCKNPPVNNELSKLSAFVSFSVPSGTLIMHILFIFMAFCKSWRLYSLFHSFFSDWVILIDLFYAHWFFHLIGLLLKLSTYFFSTVILFFGLEFPFGSFLWFPWAWLCRD